MKINIRKMQSGGSMGSSAQAYGFLDYIPFIAQQPVNPYAQPVSTQQVSTKTETPSKDKKDNDLVSKEIANALLKGGLKSDVDVFLIKLNNLLNIKDKMIAQTSDPFNPEAAKINTSWLERQQLSIISDLVKIRDNKEVFDAAMKAAGEAGALNEVALDANGDMMVITDKGKVAHIDADFYSKHRDKFKPITNKELASLRNNDMRLAFHNDSLTVLQGAVGTKEIDEVIRNTINKAQYSSQSSINYIKGDDKQAIKQGLQLLKDGVYKKSETYKNNSKQINAALQYLYKNLQPQYRKFLEAKAAMNGDNPKKGSIDLIIQYANARELNEYNYDLDYEASASKDATDSSGKSGKSSGSSTVAVDYFEKMAGMTPLHEDAVVTYTLNPRSKIEFSVHNSPIYNELPTLTKKPLNSISTLETVFDDTKMSVIIDKSNVYAGNQKVNPVDLDKIIIDNSQGYIVTILPVKTDTNGKKVVDIDLAKKIETVKKQIPEGATPLEIQEIYNKNRIGEWANVDNFKQAYTQELYRQGKLAPFVIVSGYLPEKYFDVDSNIGLDKLEDSDLSDSIWDKVNIDREQHNLETLDKPWFDDDLYSTSIFMPITPSASAEVMLHNEAVNVAKSEREQEKVLGINSKDEIKSNL